MFSLLSLTPALYAASTYWAMVAEVHSFLKVPAGTFHRHYKLAPWADDATHQALKECASRYERLFKPPA